MTQSDELEELRDRLKDWKSGKKSPTPKARGGGAGGAFFGEEKGGVEAAEEKAAAAKAEVSKMKAAEGKMRARNEEMEKKLAALEAEKMNSFGNEKKSIICAVM